MCLSGSDDGRFLFSSEKGRFPDPAGGKRVCRCHPSSYRFSLPFLFWFFPQVFGADLFPAYPSGSDPAGFPRVCVAGSPVFRGLVRSGKHFPFFPGRPFSFHVPVFFAQPWPVFRVPERSPGFSGDPSCRCACKRKGIGRAGTGRRALQCRLRLQKGR